MRRVLLILLMFVLPLQLVWAAAAVHCDHETGPDSVHFGHHQHDHDHAAAPHVGDGGSAGAHADEGTSGQDVDADCPSCLGHGSVAVIGVPGLPGQGATPGPAARPLARLPAPVPEDLLRPPRTHRA